MKTLFNAVRAAIFGAAFIFLWGWVALGVRSRYDDTLGFALAGWTRGLGAVVMAAGGILAFARGDVRYPRGGNAGAVRSTAQVCCRRALQVRAQSNVYRRVHHAFWLRAVRAVGRHSGLYSAVASARSSLCYPLRRAAPSRDVWLAVRGVLPIGAPVAAAALAGAATYVESSRIVMDGGRILTMDRVDPTFEFNGLALC
jgi:hypothetical protein